eukprot:352421-Chlamydomonas_euryale.AAC.3
MAFAGRMLLTGGAAARRTRGMPAVRRRATTMVARRLQRQSRRHAAVRSLRVCQSQCLTGVARARRALRHELEAWEVDAECLPAASGGPWSTRPTESGRRAARRGQHRD